MATNMLTAKQVAEQLGISARLVYDLAARGELPVYRIASALRFDPQDVEAYRASCRSVGTRGTSAGGSSSTVTLRGAAPDILACFRRAGVKPRLTSSTAKKAP